MNAYSGRMSKIKALYTSDGRFAMVNGRITSVEISPYENFLKVTLEGEDDKGQQVFQPFLVHNSHPISKGETILIHSETMASWYPVKEDNKIVQAIRRYNGR